MLLPGSWLYVYKRTHTTYIIKGRMANDHFSADAHNTRTHKGISKLPQVTRITGNDIIFNTFWYCGTMCMSGPLSKVIFPIQVNYLRWFCCPAVVGSSRGVFQNGV
ncbi:uncharacterized protein LOC126470559 [Schistocerca serialis cubense]|uniref:uncharacterized protein LOC126470559 n=1 Tax=Schistocerca serialis cubense TaxID=2023355 RepID=UPI00214E298B|nr:uncharacterized protein LOC126470559 [Schistocerca serialis cubense]